MSKDKPTGAKQHVRPAYRNQWTDARQMLIVLVAHCQQEREKDYIRSAATKADMPGNV